MLSFGTEFFFAFWIASYSVGLPIGSPPPMRAATSTFLIKRAKSLPRLASMTAFLCLVVAHFEWPDISNPPLTLAGPAHHRHEVPVQTGVAGELGVEGGREHVLLPNRDNPTGGRSGRDAPQCARRAAEPFHPRRTDEHRVERAAIDAVDVHRRLE